MQLCSNFRIADPLIKTVLSGVSVRLKPSRNYIRTCAMAVAKTLKLNTGVEIPTLGLGTYLSESDVGIKAVVIGLQSGYKLIDTAECVISSLA